MTGPVVRIETLEGGDAIRARFEPLADVRIEVFHDFPYLYVGSRGYEAEYLETYFRSPRSFAALAWDGERCVGATTAIPLADAEPDVQRPFVRAGIDVADIVYLGESMLLKPYRGRGLGVSFFALREAHAQRLGLNICAFCAVDRAMEHPARPADYLPNDLFWSRRGYTRHPELVAHYDWTDIGDCAPTSKSMTFWLRRLAPTT